MTKIYQELKAKAKVLEIIDRRRVETGDPALVQPSSAESSTIASRNSRRMQVIPVGVGRVEVAIAAVCANAEHLNFSQHNRETPLVYEIDNELPACPITTLSQVEAAGGPLKGLIDC